MPRQFLRGIKIMLLRAAAIQTYSQTRLFIFLLLPFFGYMEKDLSFFPEKYLRPKLFPKLRLLKFNEMSVKNLHYQTICYRALKKSSDS